MLLALFVPFWCSILQLFVKILLGRRLWPEYFFIAKSTSGPAGSPSLYVDINQKHCLDAFFMNYKGTTPPHTHTKKRVYLYTRFLVWAWVGVYALHVPVHFISSNSNRGESKTRDGRVLNRID